MPMLRAGNIEYEMAERTRAIECGGIGAFHLLARNSGLVAAIDRNVHVLKRHLPYFESDHVLNVAYNTLTGGTCLDDIEQHRNNETYMDALGAQRIPDPTTEGDFTRRFNATQVLALMETVNAIRPKMWNKGLTRAERRVAILDVDGTIAPTTGECKEGMGLSYKGVWGYHPLLVSLANTMEPLYLVNRSGNRPSHDNAVEWINRAISLVGTMFDQVILRGDTDFSLTVHFDEWTEEGTLFAFGFDTTKRLITMAEALDPKAWKVLKRKKRGSPDAVPRRKPDNVKDRIVREKEYDNIRLQSEHVAEFDYQPGKCSRPYRLIVLRKNLSIEKGERKLFDDVRYFFYISNVEHMSAQELVVFCNERCNQENLIDQLKNGLNALRMPVGDLVSNWAHMVMASMAWTLKAWLALNCRRKTERDALLAMEFRRFLNGVVRLPAQIVRTGRRIVYRILCYNEWVAVFLRTFEEIRALCFT